MATSTSATTHPNNSQSAADVARNTSLTSAVYESQSSAWSKINKVYGIFTVLAVLVSVILCVVEGTKSHRKPTDFLLLANIVCTSFVATVHVWWYRRSHLAEDKVWFLLLIYTVLLLQCITSIIYLFTDVDETPTTTTHMPVTTHHPRRTTAHHHTKIHWIPIRNSSTIIPPHII